MFKLMTYGLLAAFLFSSTFVLNTWLNSEGGHWFWTASLRYVFVFALLTLLLTLVGGTRLLADSAHCFLRHIRFWLLAGGVGFAAFYLLLCFAASYAPGWVIATSWQLTVLASPLVLRFLGVYVRPTTYLLALLVFAGVTAVNLEHFSTLSRESLLALGPVALAAFCYPFGNSICGFARTGIHSKITHISTSAMDTTFGRVWLMTAGALPILLLVGVLVGPPRPTSEQVVSTFFIAIFTGVIATSIFLYARHTAKTPSGIAAIDATQAAEVPFALLVEWLFFAGTLPGLKGTIGIAALVLGNLALARSDASSERSNRKHAQDNTRSHQPLPAPASTTRTPR